MYIKYLICLIYSYLKSYKKKTLLRIRKCDLMPPPQSLYHIVISVLIDKGNDIE